MEEVAPVRHRRRLSAFALLLLAGCNQVFGLRETEPLPDALVIDEDLDGAADEIDNCPGRMNPSQSDQDRDTLGDACDNCPLVPNPLQQHIGDADPVGDLCDAHPAVAGDCLLLVDSFDEPAAFAERWQVFTEPGTSIDARDGSIEMTTFASTSAAFVARDLTGVLGVEVLGSSELPLDASVLAVTNMTSLTALYGCGAVAFPPPENAVQVRNGHAAGAPQVFGSGMSSPHVGSSLRIRLGVQLGEPSILAIGCRVDHGVAFGFGSLTVDAPVMTGAPGVRASGGAATIDAIAVYRFDPAATSCADPVLR